MKISELQDEALQRITEDALKLGMVTTGNPTEPEIIDINGQPWLQLSIGVRNAGELLKSAGIAA